MFFNKKTFLGFILATSLLVFSNNDKVFAYSENITHEGLVEATVGLYEKAFDNSIDNNYKKFIIIGARDEDTNIRPLNHFYDPTYNMGLFGYNSALDWVTENSASNNYSWSKTIEYYAQGDISMAYYSLGHILHLIEDMTVPEHTRSDQHLGKDGSIYETWVKNNFTQDDIVKISRGYSINKGKSLTDLRLYLLFLAKYTNENFFSRDTINNDTSFFKHDKPVLTDYDDLYVYSLDSINKDKHVLLKRNLTKNGLEYSLIDNDKADPSVLNDYFLRLSKQNIINGALVIKLFFEEGEKARLAYQEKLKAEQLAAELENQKLADKLANQGFFGNLFSGLGFIVSDTFTSVNSGVVAIVSPVINLAEAGIEIGNNTINIIFIGGTQGIKYITEQTVNLVQNLTTQTLALVENFTTQAFSSVQNIASSIFSYDATSGAIDNSDSVGIQETILDNNENNQNLISPIAQNTVSNKNEQNSEEIVLKADSKELSAEDLAQVQASIKTYLENQAKNITLTNTSYSSQNATPIIEETKTSSKQSSNHTSHHSSNNSQTTSEINTSSTTESLIDSEATTTSATTTESTTNNATTTNPIINDISTTTATTTIPIVDTATSTATTTDVVDNNASSTEPVENNTATSTATSTDPVGNTATTTEEIVTTTNNYILSLTQDPCSKSILSSVCLLLSSTVNFRWTTNSENTANYLVDWHNENGNTFSKMYSQYMTMYSKNFSDGHLYNFSIKAVDNEMNTSNVINKELNIWPHALTINEISWSGTTASSEDQWMELYNWTDLEIPLDGFVIRNEDSSIKISLDGITILPHSYLVIQRKLPGAEDFATEAPIPDISGLWIGWGRGLNPAGETIYLTSTINDQEIYVDEMSLEENWSGFGQNGRSIEKSGLASCWKNWANNDDTIAKNGHDKAGNEILGTPGKQNSIMPFYDGIPSNGSCVFQM